MIGSFNSIGDGAMPTEFNSRSYDQLREELAQFGERKVIRDTVV